MKVGAIITVPGAVKVEDFASQDRTNPQYLFQAFGGYSLACYEILGETLLQRTLNALRHSGIAHQTVLMEDSGSESLFPSRVPSAGEFFSAWDVAVGEHLDEGAELLLLLRVGAYLEIDFAGLLDFHRRSKGILTQVYDHTCAFDVAVVNTGQLRGDSGSYRGRLSALIPYHKRYHFTGYTNRLREPQDLRRLAHDALLRRNSICPVGDEVIPGIWLGEGATVDPTARVTAPVYIGSHSKVKGSCRINGATNIERDCVVDFGTTVSDSSILPRTYLGTGLNFVHSIVTSNKLFQLGRNVEVEISDRSLIGKHRSVRTLTKSIGQKWFFNRRRRQLNGIDLNFSLR